MAQRQQSRSGPDRPRDTARELRSGSTAKYRDRPTDDGMKGDGATEPNAKVTLQGEPVKLRSDGTFTMRFSLPDSRQIIPATAASADGVEERTIVLAVERNTKHLEPMIHDLNE